jgi:hypothetical protein
LNVAAQFWRSNAFHWLCVRSARQRQPCKNAEPPFEFGVHKASKCSGCIAIPSRGTATDLTCTNEGMASDG